MRALITESGKVKIVSVVNSIGPDEVAAGYVAAPAGVGPGWTDNGDGTFSPPVVIVPPLTIDEQKKRDVRAITVTTVSGKTFDGDEVAQGRMARAVIASVPGDTTQWILADNTVATVTHDELKEALLLAGQAMTAIWVA